MRKNKNARKQGKTCRPTMNGGHTGCVRTRTSNKRGKRRKQREEKKNNTEQRQQRQKQQQQPHQAPLSLTRSFRAFLQNTSVSSAGTLPRGLPALARPSSSKAATVAVSLAAFALYRPYAHAIREEAEIQEPGVKTEAETASRMDAWGRLGGGWGG